MRRQVGKSTKVLRKGFTLVELLAVITILTILGTIAMPRYGDYLNRTKLVSFQLQNQKLSHQYHAFIIERGCYPENISNCATDVYIRGIQDDDFRARENFDALVFFRCSLAQDNPPSLFWDAFGHSVFRKLNLKAFTKPQLNELFPFRGFNKPGCIVTSLGPDQQEEVYSRNFPPQVVQYNPSNGISSKGDIFYSIPENNFLEFTLFD